MSWCDRLQHESVDSHYFFQLCQAFQILLMILKAFAKLTGADTGCFRHGYTDFGHTNLGVPKFNLN